MTVREYLLLEDGTYLLLEDGSRIELEAAGTFQSMTVDIEDDVTAGAIIRDEITVEIAEDSVIGVIGSQ